MILLVKEKIDHCTNMVNAMTTRFFQLNLGNNADPSHLLFDYESLEQ
jgi:hypothetical protein